MGKYLDNLDGIESPIIAGIVALLGIVAVWLLTRLFRKESGVPLEKLLKLPKGTRIREAWPATVENGSGDGIRAVLINGVRLGGEVIVAITSNGNLAFGKHNGQLPRVILRAADIGRVKISRTGQGFVASGKGKEAADVISIDTKIADTLYLKIAQSAVGPLRKLGR